MNYTSSGHHSAHPKFKTKIVAGRLVTIPVYHTADNVSFFGSYSEQKIPANNRFSKAVPDYYNNSHAVTNDDSLKQLSNARLEAQRNKARALHQTYNSVLSPQPERKDARLLRNASFSSNPIVVGVVSSIASLSRHRLLSAFSQMRRLDPRENGVLTVYEIQDTMAIHNIYLDKQTRDRLFEEFTVNDGFVDYQKLWKFFMDCYACKDQIDIPTKENSSTYSAALMNQNIPLQDTTQGVPPGLYAELEHELRKYARQHQQCLETKLLAEMFNSLDRYGSGKILKSQVHGLCQQYLHGFDPTLLSAVLNICDTDQSGLVNYKKFLKLLAGSQPTYLPPLNNTPRSLVSSDESTDPTRKFDDKLSLSFDKRNGYVDDRKQLLDYLQTLSTPPSNEQFPGKYTRKPNSPNDNIPTGNAKKLQQIGNIGLHLSDFETQIHSRKSPTPSSPEPPHVDNDEERRESSKRPGTYDLGPEKNNEVPHIPNTSLPKSPCQQEHKEESKAKKIFATPKSRASNRKQWRQSSEKYEQNPATKTGKWWKEDLVASGNEDTNPVRDNQRKTWGQSNRIRTMKGKRKRKTFKKILKKGATSNDNKDDAASSTTTTDSEFYTTTDVEINDDERSNYCLKLSLINHVEKDDNPKDPDIKYSSDKMEFIESDKKNKSNTLNGEMKEQTKKEKQVVWNSENATELSSNSNQPAIMTTDNGDYGASESKEESPLESKPQIEQNGNAKNYPRPNTSEDIQSLCETIAERLEIESFSPKPEDSSLTLNGRTYRLYPDAVDPRQNKPANAAYKLQLEWVYGYESPIHMMTSSQLVYHVGRVVIVMDASKLHQRFYRKHTCDISAVCLDLKEMTCASVQKWDGKKCVVYIWSVVDMATMSTIHMDHAKEICVPAMAFMNMETCKPHLIVLVGSSMKEQQLRVYDLKDNNMKLSTEISNVTGVTVSPRGNMFATFGRNGHLFIHHCNENSINSKGALYGDMPAAKTVTCVVFNKNGDVITGDSNGTIYLWLSTSLRIDHAIHNAHASSSITSMLITSDGVLLSASQKQCYINAWDEQLQKLNGDYQLPSDFIGVKTLGVFDNVLVIGSVSNDIAKINLSSTPANTHPLCSASNEQQLTVLVEGHSDVITCISRDPTYTEMLASVSADGWLHMYNTNTKSTVFSVRVQGNSSCLVHHPTKEFIFVGCQDGSIHLLDSTTGSFIDKFKDVFTPISCLMLSQDGSYLCCGTRDGDLLIYNFEDDVKELEYMKTMKLFDDEAAIAGIDLDVTGAHLRIQSSSNILKYYDVTKESPATDAGPNIKWSTTTCSISYETNGLWSLKKTPSNRLPPVFDVSRDKHIIAHSTVQNLYLLGYPFLDVSKEHTTIGNIAYTTSGCYTTKPPDRMCFSCDGSKLYNTYDKAGCLWQWKIVDNSY